MGITIEKLIQFVGGQAKITKPADLNSQVGCGEIQNIRIENGWVILELAWYVTKRAGESDQRYCAEHKEKIIFAASAFVGEIDDGGLKFWRPGSGTLIVLRPPGHPTLVDGTKIHAFSVPERPEQT